MAERRVALVTGGTRGIGLGIAHALAREGLDLMLCGRRSAQEVAPAVAELASIGPDVHYVAADIGIREDREALVAATRERFGRIDVLVNNAGVAPRARVDILEASEEEFERVLRIDLQGPYFLTQAVARWMIEQAHDGRFDGRLISIGSISSSVASLGRGEYCIAKAGLSMASSLWAVRLAAYGILVYEIRPGLVHSDMTAAVQEQYDTRIADGEVPLRRWGEAEDVARATLMLVRGDLGYSTGNVILVDGGLTIPRL